MWVKLVYYKVQMQFSLDWSWKISSVRCVLESEEQAWSHENLFRALKIQTEPQDHCKDIIWISSPYFKANFFFGYLSVEAWILYRTIDQMYHIWETAYGPRKSQGLLSFGAISHYNFWTVIVNDLVDMEWIIDRRKI